ncbi:MAG TPA: hypothetical protein VHN82_07285, partial [Methanoregula sp.]|nr:hypothetical protein [Methanoregula sp.]
MHEPYLICHFVIYCTGFIAHVRIKRVTRIHCPHAWIERDAADVLATLRAIAAGPGISRELWVFLPRGSFRFFRVTDTGLIELDRSGSVLPVPEKCGPGTGIVAKAPVTGGGSVGVTSPPVRPHPPELSVGEIGSGKGQGG